MIVLFLFLLFRAALSTVAEYLQNLRETLYVHSVNKTNLSGWILISKLKLCNSGIRSRVHCTPRPLNWPESIRCEFLMIYSLTIVPEFEGILFSAFSLFNLSKIQGYFIDIYRPLQLLFHIFSVSWSICNYDK